MVGLGGARQRMSHTSTHLPLRSPSCHEACLRVSYVLGCQASLKTSQYVVFTSSAECTGLLRQAALTYNGICRFMTMLIKDVNSVKSDPFSPTVTPGR